MAANQKYKLLKSNSGARNILLVIPAMALFLLKRHYTGPLQSWIYSYGGNTTVSFALYFVFLKLCMMSPHYGRLIAALLVLIWVVFFELFDGFGIMANTYDPLDLLANGIGVGLAFSLDVILNRIPPEDPEIKKEI